MNGNAYAAEAVEAWHDTFFQYRIPLTVEIDEPGWQVVPVTATDIMAAVNRLEEFTFDPLWFAADYLKVVEIGRDGTVADTDPAAGFYLVPDPRDLARAGMEEGNDTFEIPTETNAYYLARYAATGGKSPVFRYEQIFDLGSTMRKNAYMSSYEPPLLPLQRTGHECLLRSDGTPLQVERKSRWVTGVDSVSVHRVRMAFLAHCTSPGQKEYRLYYQPLNDHHITIPSKRRADVPSRRARVKRLGEAEKYLGDTRYPVASNDRVTAWFAESTVKLTPATPAPGDAARPIRIAAAANEGQSFQVVLVPVKEFAFRGATATALRSADHRIPADRIAIRAVAYVPIVEASYTTPADYTGPMGDPLVPVAAKALTPASGNHILWVTVRVPPRTPPGVYEGSIAIKAGRNASLKLPLALEVYDFELPEFSTFHSGLGGQYMGRSADGEKSILDYHGLSTRTDVKKLARLYYDEMAVNKFYPKSVASYEEIGMDWAAPPEGMNVDKPNNFFQLKNWDFTTFNRAMAHYIDDLKVNSLCITHTNPKCANIFMHLPGKGLDAIPDSIPFSTLGWQRFREMTFVAWGMRKDDGHAVRTQEVTVEQWDRLVLDYYRAMAKNFDDHGWLDKVYICIDETEDPGRLLHLLRLLESDPLTAQIRVAACIQGLGYFIEKVNPSDERGTFDGLMTYMPQLDEPYNRWEPYFFTDYGITPDRDKLWQYAVEGSRLSIDVPGVNNRILGLEMFNRGGSGLFVWETIMPDAGQYSSADNPWVNPATVWGNGALSYFYPPRRDGPSTEPDFTIIPSLRIETYRESVDDYEYARILEDLVAAADAKGVDTADAKSALREIPRFFPSMVHWSQNDAWFLELRERIARAIERLRREVGENDTEQSGV
jgi:hypothetical protein